MTDTVSTTHTSSTDSRGTITCSICQAVYAPTPDHAYLLRASRVALESAFMSMCHFCFRCRRAACPNCWDNVHGLCATCALEAQLPFRVQTQPLKGALFPPVRQAQLARKQSIPNRLICIQPGRFQQETSLDNVEVPTQLRTSSAQGNTPQPLSPVLPESPAIDEIPTRRDPPAKRSLDGFGNAPVRPSTQPLEHFPPVAHTHTPLPPTATDEQETMKQQAPVPVRRRETIDLQRSEEQAQVTPIDKDVPPAFPSWEFPTVVRTSTPRASASKAANPADIERIKTRPASRHSRTKNDIEDIKTRPTPRSKKQSGRENDVVQTAVRKKPTGSIEEVRTRPTRRQVTQKPLENILTILSALLLLCVITLIVSALVSASANSFIESLLQIDIRAEVAYLWQVISHLFAS